MSRVFPVSVIVSVLVVLGPHTSAWTQPGTGEVLGVRLGPQLAEVTVPASGEVREATLLRHVGQEVVLVVRGAFVYSQRPGFPPGQQDAKYRWGSRLAPGAKVCPPCTDPNVGEAVSFVIDGRYREPLREDFGTHTYVYVHRVAPSGAISFQIRDDNYMDNRGGLQVVVYERI